MYIGIQQLSKSSYEHETSYTWSSTAQGSCMSTNLHDKLFEYWFVTNKSHVYLEPVVGILGEML